MLSGRFGGTTKRPFLEGFLGIPRLRVSGRLSFMVDTGADTSLLAPTDALMIGIDFRRCTPKPGRVVGIGGATKAYVEDATLVFVDDQGVTTYGYVVPLTILPYRGDTRNLVSVIGRDILNRWRMDYQPSAGTLGIEIVTADHILRVGPEG